jgi:tetratricopeptide (TPR) repeat protein
MSADIVRSHFRSGEMQLARAAALSALETAAEAERGELYSLLARSHVRLGQPREALKTAEKASRLSTHWEAILSMGEALVAEGEPFRARAVLAEALEHARDGRYTWPLTATSAPEAAHAAVSAIAVAELELLVALSDACRASGDPEEGLAFATRALGTAQATFGTASVEAAEAFHALGLCQHAAGQSARAIKSLKRAISLHRAHTPNHIDIAAALDALGAVARAQNHPFDAVKHHREALDIWRKCCGPRSGPEGACRQALAQALHRTGDFQGARAEMEEAFVITARTFGREHVDTFIARFELGRFELDCGQVEEGLKAMADARERVAEKLGSDHPTVKAMDRWL